MIGARSPANLADYVLAALAADGDDAALARLMADMAAEYGITPDREANGQLYPGVLAAYRLLAELRDPSSDAAPAMVAPGRVTRKGRHAVEQAQP